jgi:hypothetical protein
MEDPTQVPSGNQRITASIVPTMIDDAAQANIETYPLRRIVEALNNLSADPIRQQINTHWHVDHTDENAWVHSAGATITAHENTKKHLSTSTRFEGWQYDSFPHHKPEHFPRPCLMSNTICITTTPNQKKSKLSSFKMQFLMKRVCLLSGLRGAPFGKIVIHMKLHSAGVFFHWKQPATDTWARPLIPNELILIHGLMSSIF